MFQRGCFLACAWLTAVVLGAQPRTDNPFGLTAAHWKFRAGGNGSAHQFDPQGASAMLSVAQGQAGQGYLTSQASLTGDFDVQGSIYLSSWQASPASVLRAMFGVGAPDDNFTRMSFLCVTEANWARTAPESTVSGWSLTAGRYSYSPKQALNTSDRFFTFRLLRRGGQLQALRLVYLPNPSATGAGNTASWHEVARYDGQATGPLTIMVGIANTAGTDSRSFPSAVIAVRDVVVQGQTSTVSSPPYPPQPPAPPPSQPSRPQAGQSVPEPLAQAAGLSLEDLDRELSSSPAFQTGSRSVQVSPPVVPSTSRDRAINALVAGDYVTARAEINALAQRSPPDIETVLLEAQYALYTRDNAGSQARFRQVQAADPNRKLMLYEAGKGALDRGMSGHAALYFASVLGLDDRMYQAYYGYGEAAARLGRAQEAIGAYERYLQFDQTSQFAQTARQQIARLRAGR